MKKVRLNTCTEYHTVFAISKFIKKKNYGIFTFYLENIHMNLY